MTKKWLFCALALLGLFVFGSGETVGAGDNQPIQLVAATFDPLADGEPTVPTALRASAESSLFLVQFHGPMQPDWATDLTALPITFYGYVSHNAYLVKADPLGRDALSAHPAVRWMGAYHPYYKLSPSLAPGRMLVQLFPDTDADSLISAELLPLSALIERSDSAELLVIDGTLALAHQLATSDSVLWIQNAAQMVELNDNARWVTQANVPFTTPLTDRGLTGAGQVAGAADSGLAVYDFGGGTVPSCFFADDGNNGNGGTAQAPSTSHRKVIAYSNPEGAIGDNVDGSGHGSHVVGSIVGDQPPWNQLSAGDGQAFDARVYFQDIGIGSPIGLINPPSDYRVLFGEAYDPNGDGVYQPNSEPRTHSNSWGGTEPIYGIETMQTDDFMWQHPDFLILFAAGNQGPAGSTIGQPATAKNIVTVGGTENGLADPNSMGYFSSHGPAPLGRMKPTISAPGDRVSSAMNGDPCASAEKTGTSMATPNVQGVALLMRQYLWDGFYPTGAANASDRIHPSAALLKAMLINSGRAMSGTHTDNALGGAWPSNGQGWGRVTADDTLYFEGDQRGLWLHDSYALDGSQGFDASGQSQTFTLTVGDGAPFASQPLEITLAWSDYPGLPPAGGPLVNNLDMVVTAPDGTQHRGNDASSNDFEELADLPLVSPDVVNPWEVVYVADPLPGTYTITVTATNLASTLLDSRKQGFALVATGDLHGQQPQAAFEFPAYEANPSDVVRMRVMAPSANQQANTVENISAEIHTPSTTTPVTLTETSANSGVFAGSIILNDDVAVQNGDTLELRYGSARASAEIVRRPLNFINPPALHAPDNADGDHEFTLTWDSAEVSDGLVGYVVQQTDTFALPLFDDAEGAITEHWSTGQLLANWASSGDYAQSGTASFWSGRGDIVPSIDTALTLNHDVVLPTTLSSARLGFYSRYFNDFNDYGHVEISAEGGPWQPLRRLIADPRIVPLDGRMQYHEFDLTEYIGTPIRVRFRYDNGVFSQAPDSPGWWIDDVAISGGNWQTVALSAETSAALSVNVIGQYAHRVRGLYADGSVTGWSQVVTADVDHVPAPPPPAQGVERVTGGGWLATHDGKKLNVGFELREGLTGDLSLNDRSANGVKIKIDTWLSAEFDSAGCGMADGVALTGEGTIDGQAASFRACVADYGEPGKQQDRFALWCLSGCAYDSRTTTVDDVIDGGNMQVASAEAQAQSQSAAPDSTASNETEATPATLILDPLLLTDGAVGEGQLFHVRAYDADQNRLANAPITLTRTRPNGQVNTWSLLTDATGVASVLVVNVGQRVEISAEFGDLHANAIELTPRLPSLIP